MSQNNKDHILLTFLFYLAFPLAFCISIVIGPLVGALAGWLAGWLFPNWIIAGFAVFGITVIPENFTSIGAMFGFVSMFISMNSVKQITRNRLENIVKNDLYE